MVTIVITACPASLRGHLTRWLSEVSPGVFVGKVNSRIRERLWALVVSEVKNGRAIMTFSSREREQGYDFLVHNHEWEVVDLDGLSLIRRPSAKASRPKMKRGWSRQSQKRRA